MRRAAGGDAASRQRQRAERAADDPFATERARFAAKIDGELRLACRSEAMMRRELGDAARALLQRRAYQRFGFVRLADYARERLGVPGRTIQEAAWMAQRFDALPVVGQAYDRSELSWAQARVICKVAVAADAARWVAIARGATVETLERLVAQVRRPDGVPDDPEGEPSTIDGEPAVRWRLACPARLRALWRRAVELASRVAGEPLAAWRAAEVIAAEASSGRPVGAAMGDRALLAAIRLARRARRRAHAAPVAAEAPVADVTAPDLPPNAALRDDASAATSIGADAASHSAAPTSGAAAFALEPPASPDPFALEARLVEAMRVLRGIEPKIGRLLRVVVDQRIYKSFGCARLDDYVRERLGFSVRKAWALLQVEKATSRSADFADAYNGGTLSWVRAVTLLPVLERTHAAAWVARAQAVTVRRLGDEVAWVLDARDVRGPEVALAPPPLDSPLPPPIAGTAPAWCRDSSPDARLQIRAHGVASTAGSLPEICDAEVRFTGPASVVALLRDVLDAFGDPYEPRWRALERLLRHVIAHWESLPRHPDPIFARDGWRCTVPACGSRRNLHDHHLRFRSRGGGNSHDNRTTVCAGHHLHGIHAGTIAASGSAPHAIEWRLGMRPNAPPLLTFLGDRYLPAEKTARA
jgi:hypothetical protein